MFWSNSVSGLKEKTFSEAICVKDSKKPRIYFNFYHSAIKVALKLGINWYTIF